MQRADDAQIDRVTIDAMEMTWDASTRIAVVRVRSGAKLGAKDGADLVDTIAGWIGNTPKAFAIVADGGGGHTTDGAYRARLSRFFRRHRETGHVAFVDLGSVLTVVVEMFRVATNFQLRAFTSETQARAWLRTKGFAA